MSPAGWVGASQRESLQLQESEKAQLRRGDKEREFSLMGLYHIRGYRVVFFLSLKEQFDILVETFLEKLDRRPVW